MISPILINSVKNPWHPSVVYVPEGWCGYKYWMAESPFPPHAVKPYRDRYECPNVHFSNDGLHWDSVLVNPIDDLTSEEIKNKDYFSDPHLVLHDNKLELYYRYISGNSKHTVIFMKSSIDGANWSDRKRIIDTDNQTDVSIFGNEIISPSFVYDCNILTCWYVDDTYTNICRRIICIKDAIGNPKRSECVLKGEHNIIPWHIDVQFFSEKFYLLVYDCNHKNISLFLSDDGVEFVFDKIILVPSHSIKDYYIYIYRACSISTSYQSINIYFSAANKAESYIGLIQYKNNIVELIDCQVDNCLLGGGKCRYVVKFWTNILVFYLFKVVRKLFKIDICFQL